MNISSCVLCTVVLGGTAFAAATSQNLEPKAAAKEEILKQLDSASPIRGDLLNDEKLVCSFDSAKGYGTPQGFINLGPAVKRAETGTLPKLIVKLSPGADPKRLLLTKEGSLAAPIRMVFSSSPNDASRYTVAFDKPLEPGNYELGIVYGDLPIFVRCGITVKK